MEQDCLAATFGISCKLHCCLGLGFRVTTTNLSLVLILYHCMYSSYSPVNALHFSLFGFPGAYFAFTCSH